MSLADQKHYGIDGLRQRVAGLAHHPRQRAVAAVPREAEGVAVVVGAVGRLRRMSPEKSQAGL